MNRCTHKDRKTGQDAWLPLTFFIAATAMLSAGTSAWAQEKQSPTAQLVQRIEQLEEQIVDMQVIIGTLQSLPRGTTAPPAPGGLSAGSANDSARLDGMETQIRALTAQLAQLAQQVRAKSAPIGNRSGALTGANPQASAQPGPAPGPAAQETGAITGFGSTTIKPSDGPSIDPIGGYLQAPGNQAPGNSESTVAARQPDNVPDRSNPKRAYETAYGYLLQQQYGAAQSAFSEFVRSHPKDALAGNAQYWLGETFFLRGQYKTAASAFLKGYESFPASSKAADSLLKLAMSLDRLGHKDAACSSLSELKTRFPAAPAHVKKRAVSERKRVGC